LLKPATRLAGLSYGLRGTLPQLADDLEQRGHSIIRLHLGDPGAHHIPAPPVVLDAIRRSLHDSCGYSPTQGLPVARNAIASYYHDRGLALTPADILMGNGVSELVLLALQALLNPGDEVLVPTPGYPLWPAAIHLAGGTPIPYHCDEQAGWQPDPDHLTSQISPRTVALVANTPHNPTGAVWGAAVLRMLAEIARRHRLVLMSDEIYAHIVHDTKHTILATPPPTCPA
jgi:alanine-synthesizing transaminase